MLTHVGANVSHEWIYRFVALDKRQGGKLYRHLLQGHKRYRRGKKEREPVIKNAVSIDERPEVVDNSERFGGWEIDTVLGKHGTGAIVTILERETIIMPHPERVFRTVANSWHPDEWAEDSPWMRMFRNARVKLG